MFIITKNEHEHKYMDTVRNTADYYCNVLGIKTFKNIQIDRAETEKPNAFVYPLGLEVTAGFVKNVEAGSLRFNRVIAHEVAHKRNLDVNIGLFKARIALGLSNRKHLLLSTMIELRADMLANKLVGINSEQMYISCFDYLIATDSAIWDKARSFKLGYPDLNMRVELMRWYSEMSLDCLYELYLRYANEKSLFSDDKPWINFSFEQFLTFLDTLDKSWLRLFRAEL